MFTVKDLLEEHGKNLELKQLVGQEVLNREIKKPELQRPGLSLTGYLKHFPTWRLLIFGCLVGALFAWVQIASLGVVGVELLAWPRFASAHSSRTL